MQRIKILFIIDSLGYGGAERQLVELIKGLSHKKQYIIRLICLLRQDMGYKNSIEELGIKIDYFTRYCKYDLVSPLYLLIKYIHRHNISVVHTFMNMGSLYGALAAKLCGKPVVCSTIRDAMNSSAREKWLKIFISYLCDIYVANSIAGFQNRFSKMRPHFKVVYNGIDFSRFASVANPQKIRRDLGIENFTPVIGCVASLMKHKDHFTLLKAFKLILEHYSKAALLLVGDGVLRHNLEQFCMDLNINRNVFFLGFRKDVDLIYSTMDIHVLLTNTHEHLEGISNSIVEAMASGVPVIATRGGGTLEIIDDNINGILVPPADADKVAEAILQLLQNKKQKQEIINTANRKVRKMFRLNHYVHRYEEIYQDILSSK